MASTSSGASGQTSGIATVRAAPQTAELGQTQLRAGALGLVPAIMQSVTLIAPPVLLPIIAFLAYRGITVSTRLIVLFGLAEMAIVLALAVWGLFDPGKGGFNVDSFNPANITSVSGFGLAVVFSVQAFTGWDGAAPLAEETAQPRRNVPRAVIGSILILGVFLVFVEWGIMVGWGTKAVASIPTSAEFPALVLAHRFWGAAWIFMLLALFSSVMAVSQAANN